MLRVRIQTGVCGPLLPVVVEPRTQLQLCTRAQDNANCEMDLPSSCHTKILYGGQLHEELSKTTELAKLGGGQLHGSGRLLGVIRYNQMDEMLHLVVSFTPDSLSCLNKNYYSCQVLYTSLCTYMTVCPQGFVFCLLLTMLKCASFVYICTYSVALSDSQLEVLHVL